MVCLGFFLVILLYLSLYKLIVSHEKNEKISQFIYQSINNLNPDNYENLMKQIKQLEYNEAKIVDIRTRPRIINRPMSLTTVEFIKQATTLLNTKANKALEISENLYLKGLITYPRT